MCLVNASKNDVKETFQNRRLVVKAIIVRRSNDDIGTSAFSIIPIISTLENNLVLSRKNVTMTFFTYLETEKGFAIFKPGVV